MGENIINTKGLDYIFKQYVDTARSNGEQIDDNKLNELADAFNGEIRKWFSGEENRNKEMSAGDFYQGMQEVLSVENQEALKAMADAIAEMSGLDENAGTISFDDLFGDATSYYDEDIQAQVAQQRAEQQEAFANVQAQNSSDVQVSANQAPETLVYGATYTPQQTSGYTQTTQDTQEDPDWYYNFSKDSDLGKALLGGAETDEFTGGPPEADFMDKDGNYYDKAGKKIDLKENEQERHIAYLNAYNDYEALLKSGTTDKNKLDAARASFVDAINNDLQYRGQVQSTYTSDDGKTQIIEYADGTKAYYTKGEDGEWKLSPWEYQGSWG